MHGGTTTHRSEPRGVSPLHQSNDLYPASALLEALEALANNIAAGRQWMDRKQAAEFLGLAQSTFDALAARGDIPRHRFEGAGYRYHAPELTAVLLSL